MKNPEVLIIGEEREARRLEDAVKAYERVPLQVQTVGVRRRIPDPENNDYSICLLPLFDQSSEGLRDFLSKEYPLIRIVYYVDPEDFGRKVNINPRRLVKYGSRNVHDQIIGENSIEQDTPRVFEGLRQEGYFRGIINPAIEGMGRYGEAIFDRLIHPDTIENFGTIHVHSNHLSEASHTGTGFGYKEFETAKNIVDLVKQGKVVFHDELRKLVKAPPDYIIQAGAGGPHIESYNKVGILRSRNRISMKESEFLFGRTAPSLCELAFEVENEGLEIPIDPGGNPNGAGGLIMGRIYDPSRISSTTSDGGRARKIILKRVIDRIKLAQDSHYLKRDRYPKILREIDPRKLKVSDIRNVVVFGEHHIPLVGDMSEAYVMYENQRIPLLELGSISRSSVEEDLIKVGPEAIRHSRRVSSVPPQDTPDAIALRLSHMARYMDLPEFMTITEFYPQYNRKRGAYFQGPPGGIPVEVRRSRPEVTECAAQQDRLVESFIRRQREILGAYRTPS